MCYRYIDKVIHTDVLEIKGAEFWRRHSALKLSLLKQSMTKELIYSTVLQNFCRKETGRRLSTCAPDDCSSQGDHRAALCRFECWEIELLAILLITMMEPFKVRKPHFQKSPIIIFKLFRALRNDKFEKSLGEFNYKLKNLKNLK